MLFEMVVTTSLLIIAFFSFMSFMALCWIVADLKEKK